MSSEVPLSSAILLQATVFVIQLSLVINVKLVLVTTMDFLIRHVQVCTSVKHHVIISVLTIHPSTYIDLSLHEIEFRQDTRLYRNCDDAEI